QVDHRLLGPTPGGTPRIPSGPPGQPPAAGAAGGRRPPPKGGVPGPPHLRHHHDQPPRRVHPQVTPRHRDGGHAGKLGGQAQVREVTGVWKDLTESVNSMASNLTAQVRNLAEVTIAVANGDLSKKITVDVRGEILQLKEAINTMVDQLRSFASEVT